MLGHPCRQVPRCVSSRREVAGSVRISRAAAICGRPVCCPANDDPPCTQSGRKHSTTAEERTRDKARRDEREKRGVCRCAHRAWACVLAAACRRGCPGERRGEDRSGSGTPRHPSPVTRHPSPVTPSPFPFPSRILVFNFCGLPPGSFPHHQPEPSQCPTNARTAATQNCKQAAL